MLFRSILMNDTPPPPATASLIVGDKHTAIAVGSGDVPCWRLSGWLHCANKRPSPQWPACSVRMRHRWESTSISSLIASTSGATVTATAEIQSFDHSRFVCSVDAYEGSDLVGRGTIVRVRVDRQRFVRDRGKL